MIGYLSIETVYAKGQGRMMERCPSSLDKREVAGVSAGY